MATYRLQPARSGKYFALVCVVVAVAIAAPSAVLSLVSQNPKPSEAVSIGPISSDWEIPVEGVGCVWDPNGMLPQAYLCGGVSVQVNKVIDVEDSDHSLRRAVRANMLIPFTNDPIIHSGNASVMAIPGANLVAMSVQGSGDYAGEEFQILIQGNANELVPLSNQIWDSFHDDPLPIDLDATMEQLPEGLMPGIPQMPDNQVPSLNAKAFNEGRDNAGSVHAYGNEVRA